MIQSSANYITSFHSTHPFKMVKEIRYVGHVVRGNSIRFNVCRLGKFVLTGSADGHAVIYDYNTTHIVSVNEKSDV